MWLNSIRNRSNKPFSEAIRFNRAWVHNIHDNKSLQVLVRDPVAWQHLGVCVAGGQEEV